MIFVYYVINKSSLIIHTSVYTGLFCARLHDIHGAFLYRLFIEYAHERLTDTHSTDSDSSSKADKKKWSVKVVKVKKVRCFWYNAIYNPCTLIDNYK